MIRQLFVLTTLFPLLAFCQGYRFDCLDDCECDTVDEIIHCHNGERTQLKLPAGQRLRGFPVIGITYNNIKRLPDEETLLLKFPDLKVIDIERNPEFDCDSLSEYSNIKIVSDCFKNVSEISRVPRLFRPTRECDVACQASRHYAKLHEYVLSLWEIMKEKYENFDFDETLRQIQKFFVMIVKKMNDVGKEIGDHIDREMAKHPKKISVTPSPELEEIPPFSN